MSSSVWARSLFASAIVGICASACSGQSNGALPLQRDALAPLVSLPLAVPRDCKGQKKKGSDASVTETLKAHGGSLCIPAIGGVGGTLDYPNAKPSVKVTVTATTKDNHFPYPANMPNAKAVIYVELATTTITTFGTTFRSGAGVIGKGIKPHSMYTAYAWSWHFKVWEGGSSCFAVAKGGKHGGVVGLGSLLSGQSVGVGEFSGSPFLIEIFPGQLSNTPC